MLIILVGCLVAEVAEVDVVNADAIIENDPYLLLHNALREVATQLIGDEGADWLERT